MIHKWGVSLGTSAKIALASFTGALPAGITELFLNYPVQGKPRVAPCIAEDNPENQWGQEQKSGIFVEPNSEAGTWQQPRESEGTPISKSSIFYPYLHV